MLKDAVITKHLQSFLGVYNEAAMFSCWLKFDLQVTVRAIMSYTFKSV